MKSVIIALQMAGEPGRRKLSGVLDYVLEEFFGDCPRRFMCGVKGPVPGGIMTWRTKS